jgi:parvulin-like peptidyl-prolyl isomerase
MNDSRARKLLLSGVIIGILLAAFGLLRSGEPAAYRTVLPDGAVVQVNGFPISADLYARLLGGLAAERKTQELTLDDRQRILDRMIDEELLLQRGLELGLARTDQIIRRQIVAALTTSIKAEAEDVTPDDAELQRFCEEHMDLFTRTDRLSFAQIFFRVPSAAEDTPIRQRAEEATQRLRMGESLEVVNKELGDEPVLRLPSDSLPAEKIQEYLGPTATQALLALAPGEVSDPVRSGIGYHVLLLHARQPAAVPPFETIREHVLTQYRRVAGEKAVAAYVTELRKLAHVQTAETWMTTEEERTVKAED